MDSFGKPAFSTPWQRLRNNRWVIASAGVLVMMMTGTLYSWAIFTQPLAASFHWDVRESTWAYAIANFCLAAVGALIGGFWQDRRGPRRVAVTGMVLWGLGNILAGWGTAAWGAAWLYLCYGVIGGVGAGMAYISPVSMVIKWFPERRGLAGGMVAAGFGLGAFFYNQLVPRLASFHAAANHASELIAARVTATGATGTSAAARMPLGQAMAQSDIAAVMQVFISSGCLYLTVGVLAASLFRNPPAHAAVGRQAETPPAPQGLSPSAVVRTPQFYLLWLQLFTNSFAGIAIISNAIFILQDLTQLPLGNIAPLFGLVSAFNAAGRLFWGAVSDRIGCRHTFALMFVIQAVVLFLLHDIHDLNLALAAFAVVLLCCGGGFGTMPAYNAEYFGTRFMGLNYGLILSAWGFAGLIGPLLIARAKDLTGSFAGTLPLVASVLLASVALPWMTSRPKAQGSATRDRNSPELQEAPLSS
jgi:nitrate/nitrite transporter NarK